MPIETFAGLAIVPIVQVTVVVVVPEVVQEPMDALADTNVTVAGSTSVTRYVAGGIRTGVADRDRIGERRADRDRIRRVAAW